MKKILHLAMLVMFVLTGTVLVSANPNGGVPKGYTFPTGMSPVQTINYFHHKIVDGDYGLAHDVLTEDYKNFFQSYDDFKKGYSTTLTSKPENFRVSEQTDHRATLTYIIKSRDKLANHHIVEQTFECTTVLKKIDDNWLIDNGTGELLERTELNSYQSAAAVLRSYHECITNRELRAAWNMLDDTYKQSFGGFSAFCNGFTTTVSSDVSNILPVADGFNELALEYTLTAKDSTNETNVVQVFDGMAQMILTPDKGWRILSAENHLKEQFFPPKW